MPPTQALEQDVPTHYRREPSSQRQQSISIFSNGRIKPSCASIRSYLSGSRPSNNSSTRRRGSPSRCRATAGPSSTRGGSAKLTGICPTWKHVYISAGCVISRGVQDTVNGLCLHGVLFIWRFYATSLLSSSLLHYDTTSQLRGIIRRLCLIYCRRPDAWSHHRRGSEISALYPRHSCLGLLPYISPSNLLSSSSFPCV